MCACLNILLHSAVHCVCSLCDIELLEPGENVMADMEFDIQDLLGAKKITLNIPPFLGNRQCFSPHKIEKTDSSAANPS